MTLPDQTLWVSGRDLHRPLTHSADDYDDHPKNPKGDISTLANRGHFYFGLTGEEKPHPRPLSIFTTIR